MQRTAEPLGAADEAQGVACPLVLSFPRQERLHVRRVVVKRPGGRLSGHICRSVYQSIIAQMRQLSTKTSAETGSKSRSIADISADFVARGRKDHIWLTPRNRKGRNLPERPFADWIGGV